MRSGRSRNSWILLKQPKAENENGMLPSKRLSGNIMTLRIETAVMACAAEKDSDPDTLAAMAYAPKVAV